MGIGAVVIVRDEASMLDGCLSHLEFADQLIVVIDDRTVDESAKVATAHGASVTLHEFDGFAGMKNAGLAQVTEDWTLVVDADERVGPSLAHEMSRALRTGVDGYRIERANYFLGRQMHWGGWSERQIRLFRTGVASYEGQLHERLRFSSSAPSIGDLRSPLHHFTHRSVIDDLTKSANFSEVWAQEQKRGGAPPVRAASLYWVFVREIAYRLVWKRGWKDGIPGVIESLYQPFSAVAGRARLWELQQSPTIGERYAQLERDLS